MKVEVVRSPRRRKTVQAREVDGVLRVSIPATMTTADEQRWVTEMVRRMERRSASNEIDLVRRAAGLARRYRLAQPATIVWSDNQEWRWGSCTPADGSIRISSRLAGEPGWVLDYVIIHELAHLSVARHNRAFWSIVERYPLTERARGFLMARGREPAPGGSGADNAEDNEEGADGDVCGGGQPEPHAGAGSVPSPGRAVAGRARKPHASQGGSPRSAPWPRSAAARKAPARSVGDREAGR